VAFFAEVRFPPVNFQSHSHTFRSSIWEDVSCCGWWIPRKICVVLGCVAQRAVPVCCWSLLLEGLPSTRCGSVLILEQNNQFFISKPQFGRTPNLHESKNHSTCCRRKWEPATSLPQSKTNYTVHLYTDANENQQPLYLNPRPTTLYICKSRQSSQLQNNIEIANCKTTCLFTIWNNFLQVSGIQPAHTYHIRFFLVLDNLSQAFTRQRHISQIRAALLINHS